MATSTAEAPRTLDEAYGIARHTSDLTVVGGMVPEGHPNRNADLLIASGMMAAGGRHRIGLALLDMQKEWEGCDRPPKRSDAQIAARAAQLLDKKGRPDRQRAQAEALVWHARVLRERALKLRSRAAVIGLLTQWANTRGIDVDLIGPALFHWLAPACPACDGVGRLAARWPVMGGICKHCNGTRVWPRPFGAEAIHAHISYCIGNAMGGIAGRLR